MIIKKTILFIHNIYLNKGGEDTVVKNELDTLQKNGYQVYYKEYNNQSISKQGIGKLLLPITLFFNFLAFVKIFLLIRKNKIGIVHVHNFFYAASPAVFWAAKAAGASTVLTIHNYRLFCLNGLFFRDGKNCFECHLNKNFHSGIEHKCFKTSSISSMALAKSLNFHRQIGTWKKKVDAFIAINPFMPHLLTDIGIKPEKIFVNPNFLFNSTNPRISKYTDRSDYYLFVGRLSPEKGIEHLVIALKKLKRKLVIIGDGELRTFIKDHVTSDIIFLGQKKTEEIYEYYRNCNALIFPSLWIEGMPMTLIEAQSTGAISIAARSVNTEAMINDGEDGFLYEAGNEEDLIRVINIFETQTIEQLCNLSQKGYEKFLSKFSETQHMKNLSEIYRSFDK